MKEDKWAALHRAEQGEYRSNPLWGANGICHNVGSRDYPWKCDICFKLKQFSSLEDCEPHVETELHQNRIWEAYGAHGDQPPVVPQWSSRRAARRVSTPIIGGTPSPPDPSGRPPPASVPRDRPLTAPAGNGSYTVSLRNVTFNDVPIAGATLTVTLPCDIEPPPFANFEIDGARIYGEILPAHSSTARGPSPSLLLSQMGAGDLAVDDSSSLRRSMAQPEPASATFDTSAQASSRQPTNGGLLPGMRVVFTNPPQPWTAYPKPPPPWPARGAPAGASCHSAASVRAVVRRGQCQREGDEEQESSDS